MAASFSSDTQPGTYLVTSGGKTHEVDADRYAYGDDGNLQMWDGEKVVAEFRWWDSITIKQD